MSDKEVWFVTGAGRGLGTDIARAALEAGHDVVATGRDPEAVVAALGETANLLAVKLDVINPIDADEAVKAAINRFGRIDVLINNAANFEAGFFEELSPGQIESQISTSLYGPMNVTRSVLPIMRKQRSGLIMTVSSVAGLVGGEFTSAYAASKFGIEGWMESLQAEIGRFGINTTIVNPGFFRTELLTKESTNYANNHLEDYDEQRKQQLAFWTEMNGKQAGDPAKLAHALVKLASEEHPPLRFIAGSDAVAVTEQVIATLQDQLDSNRDLSTSLAHDDTVSN